MLPPPSRSGTQRALRFELTFGLAQPRPPTLTGGQLVAARVAVNLVLGRVDGLRRFEDLARELLAIDVRVALPNRPAIAS